MNAVTGVSPARASRELSPLCVIPRADRLVDLTTSIFIFVTCSTIYIPFGVSIGGLNARASQFLLPFFLLLLFTRRGRPAVRAAAYVTVSGAAFVIALLYATIRNYFGDQGLVPLGRVFLYGLNLLHMAAIYMAILRLGNPLGAVKAYVYSVSAFNGYFLIIAFVARSGLPVPFSVVTMSEQPVFVGGHVASAQVARFESGGVLAGCVSAVSLIIILCLLISGGWTRGERRKLGVCAILTGMGIIIGFSRQSFLSFVVGIGAVFAYLMIRQGIVATVKACIGTLAVSAAAIVLLMFSSVGEGYGRAFAGRVLMLADEDSYSVGTAKDRIDLWTAMWEDVLRNPFIGVGQDAYMVYFPSPSGGGSHNFPLEVLHAGGLLAFLPYLLLHAIPLWLGIRMVLFSHRHQATLRWTILGLLLGSVALILASFTNLVYWNPVYWILLGILLSSSVLRQWEITVSR